MHTSLSKKLLAGLLSLVMVLSLVAPSMGTQAASKYSLTDKKSVKSDVTYKYQLKGVSKNQYVKVTRNVSGETVKYNKKAVSKTTKINGTGKTLNLYVTYGDKVANYTGKFTAKVYSKKTNKVVKTLTEKATVKVTPLEVNKVEVASTNGKYVVAYFSKALNTLKAADITIRQKDTKELKGIASVELASDGKSATIALVGSEEANYRNEFIEANTWYTFEVTQKGVTASAEFSMDDVADNCVVTDVDAVKNMVELDGNLLLTVPSTIEMDYEEMLGKTVTVWFNDDDTITKLVKQDKKAPIYGGFKVYNDGKKAYLLDLVTGAKYYTQDTSVTGTTTRQTGMIAKTQRGNEWEWYTCDDAPDKALISYAKLVLNNNGTIKTIVADKKWNQMIPAEKVEGNTVITASGATKYNLTNYTIVKEGKTVSVADVKEGDIIFADTISKFAEIYTTSVTGKINASYDNEFKFNDKKYAYSDSPYDFSVKYVYPGLGVYALDMDTVDSYIAGGKDLTVFFDRKGNPVFVQGTFGEVKTTATTLILSEQAEVSKVGLQTFIAVKGFNPETKTIESYNLSVDAIQTVVNEAGTEFTVGKDDPTVPANTATKRVTGFKFTPAAVAKVDATTMTKATGAPDPTNLTVSADMDTELKAGTRFVFEKDEAGKVIAINYNQYKSGETASLGTGNGVAKFQGGMSKITLNGKAYEIPGSAKVYVVGPKSAAYAYEKADTFTVTEYKDFKGVVKAAGYDCVRVYLNAANKVSTVIIDADAIDKADATRIKAVVVNESSRNGFVNELTVGYGKETKVFNVYSQRIAAGTYAIGTIVDIDLEDDNVTVQAVAKTVGAVEGAMIDINKVHAANRLPLVDGTTLKLAATTTVTVARVIYNGTEASLELIDFNDLWDGTVKTANEVSYSAFADGSGTTDVIVVTSVDSNTTLVTAAQTAITTAHTAFTTLQGAKTVGNYNAFVAALTAAGNAVQLVDDCGMNVYSIPNFNVYTTLRTEKTALNTKIAADKAAISGATTELTAPYASATGALDAANAVKALATNGTVDSAKAAAAPNWIDGNYQVIYTMIDGSTVSVTFTNITTPGVVAGATIF